MQTRLRKGRYEVNRWKLGDGSIHYRAGFISKSGVEFEYNPIFKTIDDAVAYIKENRHKGRRTRRKLVYAFDIK